jgi:hypothetical protein
VRATNREEWEGRGWGGKGGRHWHIISPFQETRKLSFLDQPASGDLWRDAIAIEKSDRFQDFFLLLERLIGPRL